jgi:3-phosphoshikimate 1-carboxyvinyltransferase
MNIQLNKAGKSVKGKLRLVSSKSESNRVLIIKAVSRLKLKIRNVSESKDTATLEDILATERMRPAVEYTPLYDVGPAGTTMRFLTALFACRPGNYVVTGSERMKRRPIRHLVDALKSLGADITYLETEGNPPVKIRGKKLRGGEIEMDGSVSSQFTSALIMVAPLLENGLILNFKNGLVSRSYVKMTASVMEKFGIKVEMSADRIIVPPGDYKILQEDDSIYYVEGDWSSASYWYAIAALSERAEIEIEGLRKDSAQADAVCVDIFKKFGVETEFVENGIRLKKVSEIKPIEFNYDFADCPDIAQTLAVVCAAKKINAVFAGLKTLKVKETDRISALQNELSKFNVRTEVEGDEILKIFPEGADFSKSGIEIETYEDHRMAMSFAPLACISKNLIIKNTGVIEKSYPGFWEDLIKAGFDSQKTN